METTEKTSKNLSAARDAAAHGRFVPTLVKERDGWHARWRGIEHGMDGEIDALVRRAAMTPLTADAENDSFDTVHDAWLAALKSRTGLVRRSDRECEEFAAVLEKWIENGIDRAETKRSIVFSFAAAKDGGTLSCPRPRGKAALRALGRAIRIFTPLRSLVPGKDGETLSVALSRSETEEFARYASTKLEEAGFTTEGSWTEADTETEIEFSDAPHGEAKAKATLKLDGKRTTPGELRVLLAQKQDYVFFNNHWIKLDREKLAEALELAELSSAKNMSRAKAVFLAMSAGAALKISAKGAVRRLMQAVKTGKAGFSIPTGGIKGFKGRLRGYQSRAVGWMSALSRLGFGVLLADDMGLGKTVETIAWMLLERADARGKTMHKPYLVVAPLTLVANWRREAAQFAPALSVHVHYGSQRRTEEDFIRTACESDIVITSYSILSKDVRAISSVEWQGIVLDEAQAIKNPDTLSAKTVKALSSESRVALTGTPVENSVADIWSIEDFLNPGLLGERRRFTEKYAKPLAASPSGELLDRLKKTLAPFVLRRLKTDPAIAAEIGAKRTVKEYCSLSRLQRAEYENALDDFRRGMKRRGDAFALLTRLKLICDGEGKLARLFDLLESIFAAGESALVFTQYAKVGAAVQKALEKKFGRRFPFLHGALGQKEREKEIEKFSKDGPSAFILSLRAGAFGLNLVKATHVIHFDRWWNPAVENQAADRAHRIGQTKDVLVHTFITEGTLEERVDEILEKKTRLSSGIVENGENFLLKMSAGEIESLARLDARPEFVK